MVLNCCVVFLSKNTFYIKKILQFSTSVFYPGRKANLISTLKKSSIKNANIFLNNFKKENKENRNLT